MTTDTLSTRSSRGAETGASHFVDVEVSDIHRRSARNTLIAIIAQGLKAAIHLITIVTLARLLSPDDFGVMAMVTSITIALEQLKDGGISAAFVQRAELSPAHASTLYWVSVAFTTAIALITAASAPLVSAFYGEARLVPLTLLLALAIQLSGLAMPQQAILRRHMQFGTLAVIGVVSPLIGAAVSICLAWFGGGVWGLAIQPVAQAGVQLILCTFLSPWRPSLVFVPAECRESLGMGLNLTGFTLVNYFARNLDNVLVGRLFGAASLAFYKQSYDLMTMPLTLVLSPLSAVAVASLSRLRLQPDEFRSFYRRYAGYVISLSMPLAVTMIVCAEHVIRAAFGDAWLQSVPLLRVLAVCAVVQPAINTTSWVYLSLGTTRRMFRFSIVSTALTIGAFLIGVPYGVKGIAVAYSTYVVLHAVPSFVVAFWGTDLTLRDVGKSAFVPCVGALFCGLICYAIQSWNATSSSLIIVLLCMLPVVAISCISVAIGHYRTSQP